MDFYLVQFYFTMKQLINLTSQIRKYVFCIGEINDVIKFECQSNIFNQFEDCKRIFEKYNRDINDISHYVAEGIDNRKHEDFF